MFICLDIYIYGFIPAGDGARGRGRGAFRFSSSQSLHSMSSTSSMSNFLTGRFVLGRRSGRSVHAEFIFILSYLMTLLVFFRLQTGSRKGKKFAKTLDKPCQP